MKRAAWAAFWVYQIAGCIAAAYYWDEIVEYYSLVKTLTQNFWG
jgi:hypothetical protein